MLLHNFGKNLVLKAVLQGKCAEQVVQFFLGQILEQRLIYSFNPVNLIP